MFLKQKKKKVKGFIFDYDIRLPQKIQAVKFLGTIM